MKKFLFWAKLWFRHPVGITSLLYLAWKENRAPSSWAVLVECDEDGNITRRSSWPEPCDFDTAMRRAKLENFQWIVCCYGKDEGSIAENVEWRCLQA